MQSQDKPCTLTLSDGTHYDLSSLSSAKEDYTTTIGDRTFKLNVCRTVVSEVWNVGEPEYVGGFVNKAKGDFSIGRYNETLFLSESTQQPMLCLTRGSPCGPDGATDASTAIRFVCNQNEFGAGTPQLVAALPPGEPEDHCQFFFEWHTHVACPTNPKRELEGQHYIAFFAILFIAILTWFLGHTLYNRLYLRKRGSSQFPFPSFSGDGHGHGQNASGPGAPSSTFQPSPSLFDRLKSLIPSLRKADVPRPGGWRRSQRSRGGYSHIRAAEDDEQEAGFAGRFSLDDDDDDDEEPRRLNEETVRDSVLGGEREAWGGFNSAPERQLVGATDGDGDEQGGGKGKGRA